VRRIEFAAPTEDVLADLDHLVTANRSMDFYWYPRRDDCKVRLVNPIAAAAVCRATGACWNCATVTATR
jgi:hypothetical protein